MARTAKILVRLMGGFLLLLWSGVMWAAHWLIGIGGGLFAQNADKIPGTPEWVKWLSGTARFFTGFGEWSVGALWLVVTLIVLWSMRFVGGFLESDRLQEKSEDVRLRVTSRLAGGDE
jgi:hypothetical protein